MLFNSDNFQGRSSKISVRKLIFEQYSKVPEFDETTTEESLYDLDYLVNRPDPDEDDDDDDEDKPICKYEDDHAGEGEQNEDCVDRETITPYKKYKGYKNWVSRPLLVIIIGG